MRIASLTALALVAAAPLLPGGTAAEEFFEMRVRPVLAKNCLGCHGTSKMGGLEMSSRESVLKGGNSGPAISTDKPADSLLLKVVRHEHERIKMPPQGKLGDSDIDTLAAWVKAGAVWPARAVTSSTSKSGKYRISAEQRAFWSFQPVRKPALPQVKNAEWARSPIDRFILSKIEEKGIGPAGPADRRTLLRRATYDLTGLPPTPDEVDAFLKDKRPDAFVRVVDRLLATPQYGERWGRFWLDVARYADDKLQAIGETPQPNAFWYRDWVIDAFNRDMPYDLFVKAQIAGDLLPEREKLQAGLGLYALSPELQDDRVDVTTRGFLGLTVACAQCHDHKYDPIPTTDYYSLLGIFNNTKLHEQPVAAKSVVDEYQRSKKALDEEEARLKEFIRNQAAVLGEVFSGQAAEYMRAAFEVLAGEQSAAEAAGKFSLEPGILDRWIAYLKNRTREHPYLKEWDALVADPRPAAEKREEIRRLARQFQSEVIAVIAEKKALDERNLILGGGETDRKVRFFIRFESLPRDRHWLYLEILDIRRARPGVLYFDEATLVKYLDGPWKQHLAALKSSIAMRKKELPEQYPFLYVIQDVDKPKPQHVHVRGDESTPGDVVPPRTLSILSAGEPRPFTKGTGRLELAEAIAAPDNPLTARVMVNRIWLGHFGEGIVRTPSNFGQLGERPTHPELLDYLASRFLEQKWSIKAMHREIMLSATYALSTEVSKKAQAADPGNRLFGRANVRRLDAEALRDSLLFVSGQLSTAQGGPGRALDKDNRKRTVYGYISRKRLDPVLALFDFPNPNATSEQRILTNVPLQGLFFLNSEFLAAQAEALAGKFKGVDEANGIKALYRTLFGRLPSEAELRMGVWFLSGPRQKPWEQYVSVLLSSQEFVFLS